MKESRLFQIIYYLLDKGRTTAPELAEKFEVSVRTIYRDIDKISGAGIPIYVTTGRNGGIQFIDGFVLDKFLISEQEKQEILTALQSLSVTRYPSDGHTLPKLSALFQTQYDDWIEIDYSRWGNKKNDNNKFQLLKKAILERWEISFAYINTRGDLSYRTVRPVKLIYKSTAWYLQGFCVEKQSFRVFKVHRMDRISVLDRDFEPLDAPPIESGQPIQYKEIVLRFPSQMAYRIYDEFEADQVQKQHDGAMIVTAEMPADGWLIGYLLSFGTQVEVLKPMELKKRLAKAAWEIYIENKKAFDLSDSCHECFYDIINKP